MFRLCEMQLQLGFVIFSSNDTLMLFLVPWLKGTFPFLFCFSSSDSTPAPLLPRMSLVCMLWQRGGGGADDLRGCSGCAQLHAALWWWYFGLPLLCLGLFSGLCWQKGPKINYRKSTNKETPWRLQGGDEGCTAPTVLFASVSLNAIVPSLLRLLWGCAVYTNEKASIFKSYKVLELSGSGSEALRGALSSLRSHTQLNKDSGLKSWMIAHLQTTFLL